MKHQSRPYQTESAHLLRDAIRSGASRPILGMPTGSGKTFTFSFIAELALKKGSRVGVVCHRTELVEQARDTMEAYGLPVDQISFGMVQTYVRSPHKIPPMDLCIIDECHIGNFRRFIDLLPDTVQVIGATATPVGASNKNPLNKVFDAVVYPVQIQELIEQGYLSRPVYHVWQIDESKLEKDFKGEFTDASQTKAFHFGDLLEAVNRRVGKTIIFCSSITQVEKVYESISGKEVFCVHSKMASAQRVSIVRDFKRSTDSIIINCGILTAGFDCPDIQTVIVYRATTSTALWLQMTGRGSRVTDSKSVFYIYDLGGNMARHLPWEANRDWAAIFKLQGKKITNKEAAMKYCKTCEAIIYASQMICPYCEAAQPTRTATELIADTIKVIDSYQDLPEALRKPYTEMTVHELMQRAAYGSPELGRPYKSGWIVGQIKKRDDKIELIHEYAQIKGYRSGWIERQLT